MSSSCSQRYESHEKQHAEIAKWIAKNNDYRECIEIFTRSISLLQELWYSNCFAFDFVLIFWISLKNNFTNQQINKSNQIKGKMYMLEDRDVILDHASQAKATYVDQVKQNQVADCFWFFFFWKNLLKFNILFVILIGLFFKKWKLQRYLIRFHSSHSSFF